MTYIDNYHTKIDNAGVGHIMVDIAGETIDIGTIGVVNDLDAADIHDRAKRILTANGFEIKKGATKAPKKRNKKMLFVADNDGKITLDIAGKTTTTGYILYLKGTNKFIYRIDSAGARITADGNKTTPMLFTKKDIDMLKNLDMFDVKKIECKHWIADKLS